MESLFNKRQARWWCIHFGQEGLDPTLVRKLRNFLKHVSPNVVFGNRKVFLDVTESKWKGSLYLFQTKLSQGAQKHNLSPEVWQWGVGNSLAESWVQARWKTLSPELLPLEAILDYLNPLELDERTSEANFRLQLLRELGVDSLQALIEVPEDLLLDQCGVWIDELVRKYFSRPEDLRSHWLEKITTDSLLEQNCSFQLEDWIPAEYLAVC